MAIDIKQYLTTLAQEAALDEATQAAVLKAAENDKFGKKLSEEILTRADYSRNMDELAKAKQTWEAEKKQISDWYASALPEWQRAKEDVTQERAKRLAYEQTYGPLDGTSPPANSGSGSPSPVAPDVVSKADLQKELAKLQQALADQAAGITATGMRLGIEHFKKFGEVLDFPALIKAAQDVQKEPLSPLDLAYQRLSAEKLAASQGEEQKKRDEQIRQDAIKDYLSTHHLPIDTKPKEPHPFFDRQRDVTKAPSTDSEKMNAFVGAMSSPEAQAALQKP